MTRAYAHVLEEHLAGSPDLDSCPECDDVLAERGGEKVCAGCGHRQPIINTTLATRRSSGYNWDFVAKMAKAADEHWRRKAMGETGMPPDDYMGNADHQAPEDYEQDSFPVTPGQIDQVFTMVFGHPAREADKQIVAEIGGTTAELADLIWDHWMGEPETPTLEQVKAEIEYVLEFRDTNMNGESPHLEGQAPEGPPQ